MRITIRVRPGSSSDQIGGRHADALIVRVRERPEHGKATVAALAVLAKALDVPMRDVRLISGSTSRTKVVEIPDAAASRVAEMLQTPDG